MQFEPQCIISRAAFLHLLDVRMESFILATVAAQVSLDRLGLVVVEQLAALLMKAEEGFGNVLHSVHWDGRIGRT